MKDWRERALALAVAILLAVFFSLGVGIFYPEPERMEGEEWEPYNLRRDFYRRNVFIVNIVLGTVSLVVGWMAVPAEAEAVGSGLMVGGIITLVVGVVEYWSEMEKLLKLGVVGAALAALIWVGLVKLSLGKREID